MNDNNATSNLSEKEINERKLAAIKKRNKWIWGIIIVSIILFIAFNSFTSDAGAIEQVLKQDSQTQLNLPQNNRQAVQIIVARMRAIDTSDCPSDFRAAYERHIHAWEGMRDQILSEPDGVMESFFVGFLNGLAGDWTGGVADMAQAENYWSAQIRDTFNEVRAIALQYGAQIK